MRSFVALRWMRLRRMFGTIRPATAVVPLAFPLLLIHDGHQPDSSLQQPEFPRIELTEIAPPSLPPFSSLVTVEPGDTLATVMQTAGVSDEEIHPLVRDFAEVVDPRRLRPGQELRVSYDQDRRVAALEMRLRGAGIVRATRGDDGFEVRRFELPTVTSDVLVDSEITSSLYEAITGAGESPALVQPLIDVFQWDIDFFRLQKGDRFTLVVEKKIAGGDVIGYGPIKAARFVHGGNEYEAFRFTDSGGFSGYYSRTGTPLRKQFLRSPMKYSRITSGFSHRRFHPVLQKFRPHYGVDYGAPVGTPVMATADGVVAKATFHSGNGNYVHIRHTRSMESYYLHLSRFATGIRPGVKVRQGDVIGYVGQTGLASGPHLDYRVKKDGRWLNPLELKSITPDPLGGRDLRAFRGFVDRFLPMLDPSPELLARNEQSAGASF